MRQLSMKYVGGKLPQRETQGYKIRLYTEDDYEQMLDALLPLTLERYDRAKFDSVIYRFPAVRPDGIFVADNGEKLIGTATAKLFEGYGTLHMVSALPEASGRGVGRAVCTAVVNYLVEHGCKFVDLTTDDHRLPAIATYKKLGFRPIIDDEEMRERWQALAEKLNMPELIEEAYVE